MTSSKMSGEGEGEERSRNDGEDDEDEKSLLPFCGLTDAQQWEEDQLKEEQSRLVSPYCPATVEQIQFALQAGEVGTHDTLLDIGCGDGRVCWTAVREFSARGAVGIDINPHLIDGAKMSVQERADLRPFSSKLHFIHMGVPFDEDDRAEEDGKHLRLRERGTETQKGGRTFLSQSTHGGDVDAEKGRPDPPADKRGGAEEEKKKRNCVSQSLHESTKSNTETSEKSPDACVASKPRTAARTTACGGEEEGGKENKKTNGKREDGAPSSLSLVLTAVQNEDFFIETCSRARLGQPKCMESEDKGAGRKERTSMDLAETFETGRKNEEEKHRRAASRHDYPLSDTNESSQCKAAVLAEQYRGVLELLEKHRVTVVFLYLLPRHTTRMQTLLALLLHRYGVKIISLRFRIPFSELRLNDIELAEYSPSFPCDDIDKTRRTRDPPPHLFKVHIYQSKRRRGVSRLSS